MALRKLRSTVEAQKASDKKEVKKTHAGKDWAILNTADKFEIIGDDLKARGVID